MSSEKPSKARRDWITRRTILAALAISIASQLGSSLIFLKVSSDERKANCALVSDAFDAYTDALAEVSGADDGRVDEFRDAYRPKLEECG